MKLNHHHLAQQLEWEKAQSSMVASDPLALKQIHYAAPLMVKLFAPAAVQNLDLKNLVGTAITTYEKYVG